jgi:hypothetical protein
MQLYNVMVDSNIIEFQKDILRRVQILETDALRNSVIQPMPNTVLETSDDKESEQK